MSDTCRALLEKMGTLSTSEIADVLDFVDRFKGSPVQQEAVKAKIAEIARKAANTERQAQLKAAARLRFEGTYLQSATEAIKSGKGKLGRKVHDLSTALSSFLVGTNKEMEGANVSVDKIAKSSGVSNAGELIDRLAQAGIPDFPRLADDKPFTRDLIHAMAGEGTENELAKKAAAVITKLFNENVDRLNTAGADIQLLDKYMFAQQHGPGKLAAAGFEEWYKDIRPLLDPKTFGYTPPEEFLHEIYQDIIQGKYLDPFETPSTPNLANAVSRHRFLRFKNADSALAYNEKYGNNTPIYNLVMHAIKQGHDAALLEQLGPNPGEFYNWAKTTVQNLSKKIGEEVTSEQVSRMDREFNALTGVQNRVASYTLAHNFETARAGLMMAHLGVSTLSSLTDAGNGLLNVWRAGRPLWSSIGVTARQLGRFFGNTATVGQAFKPLTPETMHALKSVAAGYDAAIHYMTSRWGVGADVNESSTRLMGWFFKMSRQAIWDDFFKAMTAHSIANTMAENAGKSFEDLPQSMQHSLFLAGLKKHWDVLRRSELTEVGGNRYLTPDKVQSKVARDTYQAYLLEQAERTVPLPGARQVATLHVGAYGGRRGELMPELWRTIMMFKSFPLGIAQKMWPNVQDTGLSGIGVYAASTIALGYAASSLKNLISGKKPNDPESMHTWLEALVQGGGLSLMGDLFGSSKGTALSDIVGGPGLQSSEDLYKLLKSPFYPGATQSPWQSMENPGIHLLKNDIPFTNLWFTKLLYQYSVIYPLMETAHPGSTAKMVNELKNKYNEQFWLKPPGS